MSNQQIDWGIIGKLVELQSSDEGVIWSVNRHVIKTRSDGRMFLLGYVSDITYVPQEGDAYLADWGAGLFVPEIEALIAKGAKAIVPYHPVMGIIELVDENT